MQCAARSGMMLGGLLAITALVGCSDGRAAIRGKVTLDGQPVEKGVIAFVPSGDKQGAAAGGEIVNGEYRISSADGPTPGNSRVEIRWSRKTGRQIPAGSPLPAGTMVDEEQEAIPRKFNVDSTLQKELKGGDNQIDFELTSS